jgi:restriction endonuclease
MIIKGPEIHEPAWGRLLELCEILEVTLAKVEDELKANSLDDSSEENWRFYIDPSWLGDDDPEERVLSKLEDARYYMETIIEKVRSKDHEDLLNDFEEFWNTAYIYTDELEPLAQEIDDILSTFEIYQGDLLYVPSEPLIEIPKLIVSASDNLLKTLARNPDLLYTLHPRKFEEVIAEIFFKNGFEVELTKATRDGGKDIIAIYNKMNISTKYVIECKRYAKERRVSIAIVQRLLGVKIAAAANKAILATTSSFTRDAMAFTSNHLWDLELKDYDDIVLWLKSYA